MDCLKGYIGLISGVGGQVESGLYLNQLEGVTSESIESILNGDQDGYDGLMNDVEARSFPKFRTFFIRELNQCYKINKREIAECLICENKELLSVSLWYLMGAELMREKTNSPRINRFTSIDKKSFQELEGDFMNAFFDELSTAVAGIDIDGSLCIEDEVEHNNLVSVIYTRP